MNCIRFDEWLDAGSPRAEAAAARAHATGCTRCAAAWRAMEAVERLAASESDTPAPAGFADTVMARVAATPQLRAVPAAAGAAALEPAHRLAPWWVRLAQQPSVIGSMALAMLFAWQSHSIAAAANSLVRALPRVSLNGVAESASLRVLENPNVVLALGAALAVPAVWAMVALFTATARLASLPAPTSGARAAR